jgi:hypothetical protein
LREVMVEEDALWGRIKLPDWHELAPTRRGRQWILPVVAIDAGFYACGVHLWRQQRNVIQLPTGIESIGWGRLPPSGAVLTCHAVCRDLAPELAVYDFTIVDEHGELVAAVKGYRSAVVRQGVAR